MDNFSRQSTAIIPNVEAEAVRPPLRDMKKNNFYHGTDYCK
jgi:hypothetical protein